MWRLSKKKRSCRPARRNDQSSVSGFLLVLPALLVLGILYIYPLFSSIAMSFVSKEGVGLHNFKKAFALYRIDVLYTIGITIITLFIVFVVAVTIAGYLRFNRWPFLNFAY